MADQVRGAGKSAVLDANALARSVNGRVVREGVSPIRGAAVDSRRVEAGNAFFALPGERTDGHLFLGDAIKRGAAALVVTRDIEVDDLWDASVIRVDDALVALQQAAAEWRNRFDPLVVGVTGSIAKTSTKEQIAEVLAERWHVLRSNANENNEIGLPLTLMRLGPEDEMAVLEMGMYEAGDIALLAALARPTIGVVTAVRAAHLARAGSMDEIERGKRELVEALPAGGTAVLNADDPRVVRMRDHVPPGAGVKTYGFAADADVRAEHVTSRGFDGMLFELRAAGDAVDVVIPALGRHSVHNALAAAAVGLVAGLDLQKIANGLTREWHAPHRTTVIDMGPIKVLDDSYNASPDTMIAALDLLVSLPGPRRVAILGEMLELGDASESEHLRVGQYALDHADLVISQAGLFGHPADILNIPREDIAVYLEPGDVILIKGSRGAAMDEMLPLLKEAAARMKAPVA